MTSSPDEAPFPRTTRALREALDAAGMRPKREHGQCFLTDAQAVSAIVRDADVRSNDVIIEVGTGPGVLTDVMCNTGAAIHTFEIDERIQSFARGLRTWPDRVRFHLLDVLASKHELAPRFAEVFSMEASSRVRVRLIANLPYAIATPLIQSVLSLPFPPHDIVVMVQADVADKMLAPFGSRTYGAPSVGIQLRAKGRVVRRFGPEVFWPRPKIQSAILELIPHATMPLTQEEHRPFLKFVTRVFTRRRKVLATGAAFAAGLTTSVTRERMAASVPELVGQRPQDVSPQAMLSLWRLLGT